MVNRPFSLTFIVFALGVSENTAQSRIDWYNINSGALSASSTSTILFSSVGQAFVGSSLQGNTQIASGFLAFLQRRTAPTSVTEEPSLPTAFELYQNHPNPFNPSTVIRYQVPGVGTHHDVSLRVYNVLGQEIATLVSERLKAGNYEAVWNAATQPSGVYIYRLVVGEFVATKRMLLLK